MAGTVNMKFAPTPTTLESRRFSLPNRSIQQEECISYAPQRQPRKNLQAPLAEQTSLTSLMGFLPEPRCPGEPIDGIFARQQAMLRSDMRDSKSRTSQQQHQLLSQLNDEMNAASPFPGLTVEELRAALEPNPIFPDEEHHPLPVDFIPQEWLNGDLD